MVHAKRFAIGEKLLVLPYINSIGTILAGMWQETQFREHNIFTPSNDKRIQTTIDSLVGCARRYFTCDDSKPNG